MKRVDFCRLALQSGMEADPRGRAVIEREPRESKAIYNDLMPEKRAVSDLETFSNPCTDRRVLHGDPEQNVNMVLADNDIWTPELLLDGRPNEKCAAVEAVCARLFWRCMVRSRYLLLFPSACPG